MICIYETTEQIDDKSAPLPTNQNLHRRADQQPHMAVGSQIPTEAELCKQFSVSRMTVNKAIRDLVNERKLERTPRLGTFVCQPKAESPLMDIRNIADEIIAAGKTITIKSLACVR